MPPITITLSLKEAETLCIAMSKVDPFGVFSGAVVKRIDEAARKSLEGMKPSTEKGNL